MASWRQRRYGHEWRPHQRASPAPLTFQRRASAANPLGRPSASLVGPGGSEGTASLQVNVSRSAGTGGAYEEHHCDLDDGDAAAGKSEGEEIGGSLMAGMQQKLLEGPAWEEWQRQPPVQRLAADGTQLSVIRAELPLLPPPPSGGVRLTALEILSAVLLQRLGLTASLQGAPHHHLVTRLNCFYCCCFSEIVDLIQGEFYSLNFRV
ncbi:hypothetical protein Vretimale_18129 [Volvox reticuliferus]|uniref:Uncharacterized protein n=1 Tax=Volvox reticuliferus TaxID=1737510 RepID=A0A8J4GWL3_9CHLO|nr:hypothetical protein Vretifemale_17761 [Volvox reticuliferus]GIM15315.1 hypothetical protein Vretimale_18129 [Volvox reticuliferus]